MSGRSLRSSGSPPVRRNLRHAQPDEAAHQRLDLVERQPRGRVEPVVVGHAIGWHAVRATEVAGLDHRQAQVAQRPRQSVDRRCDGPGVAFECGSRRSCRLRPRRGRLGQRQRFARHARRGSRARPAPRRPRGWRSGTAGSGRAARAGTRARGRRCRCATDCRASAQSCAISSPASANFANISGIGRVSPVQTTLPRRRRPNEVSGQWWRVGNTSNRTPSCQNDAPTGITWNASQKLAPPSARAFGIVAHALVQQRHQFGRHVQPHAAAPLRIEVAVDEQPLEAGDVVQVHVGDEQRARRVAVLRQVRGQAFAAAIDGQPRRAVALDGRHRRAQLHGGGVAHAVQSQAP